MILSDSNTMSSYGGGGESEAGMGNLYYYCSLGALLMFIISSLSMTAQALAHRYHLTRGGWEHSVVMVAGGLPATVVTKISSVERVRRWSE